MRGARYLAEERGAFDTEPKTQGQADEAVEPARAPLYELAATHDGQPPRDWLRMFYRNWNADVMSAE